jgi:hypothetical protein
MARLFAPRLAPVASTPPAIAVVGPLCSCDLILADAIRAEGVPVTVLRNAAVPLDDFEPALFGHLTTADVVLYRTPADLIRELRRFDVVFSFTSTIAFDLGKRFLAYPLLQRLGWPRYINISTGSDNMERAVAASFDGFLERFTMRHAFVQNLAPYPEGLRNAALLRLRNAATIPPVHTTPALTGVPPRSSRDELVLFHPSNFDWGEADAGRRASTKGNDRFLAALARLVGESNRSVRLIALDRGPDREAAHTLVQKLGLGDVVDWRAPMDRDALFAAIAESDVVVDQFDVGGLGLIAWEAMQIGRPVLTYAQENCERLLYDVPSPVFSGHTEDEILHALRVLVDPDALAKATASAREWAMARPTTAFAPRYLFYAAVATGREPIDFGWSRPFGHARGDQEVTGA